ncbi:MAG: endonuclease NucS, partial [bacterium]|nr:endonuclease NucS [bacterium]
TIGEKISFSGRRFEMRNEFERWMRTVEGKQQNTAYQYALSIDKISKHYSETTGKETDIYSLNDLILLKKLSDEYSVNGKFSDFGYKGNGTIRNAIATYVRFYESYSSGEELPLSETFLNDEDSPDQLFCENMNFTYEKDLKNSLVNQVGELFSKYKIFGNSNEGVEYLIEGKRIDLLLESHDKNELLAIEIKAGKADFKVFGQISMYLGLLSKKFPDKNLKGLIIAGSIDETLKNACLITDKVSMKTYKMQLLLENA